MQRHLIKVGPDTPLPDLGRVFVNEGISSAPVVDELERLIGVVSNGDIIRAVDDEHDSPSSGSTYFRETLEFSGPDWVNAPEDFQDRLSRLTVADVMQPSVVKVSEQTPVHEIAALMRANQIHRVLVVERESLVGIVSTFDLVALLEKPEE